MNTKQRVCYKHTEKLRLYRSLLKGAYSFPLKSRRDLVTEEIKSSFRDPHNVALSKKEIDYRLVLGWERAAAISTYANNMYWFHSRDEVNKEMMAFSLARDREKAAEIERANKVGSAVCKTPEVTEFKSQYYHYNPNYYLKREQIKRKHPHELWRTNGKYVSDIGGPRQKFYVKRYKSVFPQGW